MKNYSFSIILACVAGILLSSCSRLENITVSKRQHRSGYYVDFGAKSQTAKTPDIAKAEATAAAPAPKVAAEPNPVYSTTPSIVAETKPVSVQQVATANNTEKKSVKKNHYYASKQTSSSDIATIQQESITEHANSLADVKEVETNKSEDMPLWALVLFAIILPPLAVGLKFGIGTQFWISIILTLLFWIPGVIYALILVLS